MVVRKKEMMRAASSDWSSTHNNFPFANSKYTHIFVKLALSFLLLGISFRLFLSNSFTLLSSSSSPPFNNFLHTNQPPPSSIPQYSSNEDSPVFNDFDSDIEENRNQSSNNGKCDLFIGNWVHDPSGSFYTNQTCHAIEDHQNCMKNGRPDTGYLYWRWKPQLCDLPKFNPERFLHLMRNKSWAFIGDSISRNQVQSLLCILSQVEPAMETYHDEEYRSKIWHFPSYNFTLSVIWTPFLIKAAIFEDLNGVSSSDIELHLDELDEKWTNQYSSFDYVVVAGGKWFLKTAIYYENNVVEGCHYCPGKNLTELGFDYAYRKALQILLNFVTHSAHKAFIFLRTTTPDHFENGEWFSGGTCNRKVPFKAGEVDLRDIDSTMRSIELEEFEKIAPIASENGVTLKLLDTTQLSLLRPDGHPGPYRMYQPFANDKYAKVQNDCLHWCLPGPIDSWNDLMMAMIVKAGIH